MNGPNAATELASYCRRCSTKVHELMPQPRFIMELKILTIRPANHSERVSQSYELWNEKVTVAVHVCPETFVPWSDIL